MSRPKRKARPVIVDLTAEQMVAIKRLRAQLAKMSADGKPGMLLAQICGYQMRCGVIDHERAKAIQVASGGSGQDTIILATDKPSKGLVEGSDQEQPV